MVTREQLLAQWENLSMDESWVNPHQHIEDLITAGDRLAAALAAAPPADEDAPFRAACDRIRAVMGWKRDPREIDDLVLEALRPTIPLETFASAPPAAPPEDAHDKPAKADVWHLHAYVVDHAADHDDDCPGDDTCTCSFKARNDAVSRCVRWLIEHPRAASPAPPDPPGLLSRGQARAIHIMTNVAHGRNGRVLFACDGPDCQVCADLTLLALPRALSPLAARHSDPPGLLAKLRERVKAWRAMASLLDKDDYPCGIELSDSLDECADQIDEMLAAHTAADPQAKDPR